MTEKNREQIIDEILNEMGTTSPWFVNMPQRDAKLLLRGVKKIDECIEYLASDEYMRLRKEKDENPLDFSPYIHVVAATYDHHVVELKCDHDLDEVVAWLSHAEHENKWMVDSVWDSPSGTYIVLRGKTA